MVKLFVQAAAVDQVCKGIDNSQGLQSAIPQLVLLWFQKFCCRSVSVGFCKKNRGFRFGFGFSVPFSPCRQCGTFMRPTAHQTCSSTLHISVYNSSRQQQVSNSV